MIKIKMVLLLLLFCSTVVGAANYYVDPVNGNDVTAIADDITKPWKSLREVGNENKNIRAGDTLYLRAGTYVDAYFQPWSAGTEESPITLTGYQNEVAILTGAGKYDVCINIGFNNARAYFIIENITFQNVSAIPIQFYPFVHDSIIRNCLFINCRNVMLSVSYDNTVENCTFDKAGSIAGYGSGDNLYLRGSARILIQNNRFSHGGHYAIVIDRYVNNYSFDNIIQNNVIEQHWGGGIGLVNGSRSNLIQDNIVKFAGDAFLYPKSAIQVNTPENIVRRNIFTLTGTGKPGSHQFGVSVEGYTFSGFVQSATENRIYNNTFYKTSGAPYFLTQRTTASTKNNKVMNNIMYLNKVHGADFNFDFSDVVYETYHSFSTNKWESGQGFPNGNSYYHNAIIKTIVDSDGLFVEIPGYERMFLYSASGTNGFALSLDSLEAKYPDDFYGNVEKNPMMIDPDNDNYNLQSNSPLIDAGAYLTEIEETINQTYTIKVKDARFFTDGKRRITGDKIQIGTKPRTVTSVDYANNTLGLDQIISVVAGMPVCLVYVGSKPDIGAFEFDGLVILPTLTSTPITPTSTSTPITPTATNTLVPTAVDTPTENVIDITLLPVDDLHIEGWTPDTTMRWSEVFYYNSILTQYGARAFMKFNVGDGSEDIQIIDATLRLHINHDRYYSYGKTLVHRVTVPVDYSKVTWNTYDGSTPWTGGEISGVKTYEAAEDSVDNCGKDCKMYFDVKEAVQYWQDNPSENYGFMIKGEGFNSIQYVSSVRYYQKVDEWPELKIRYSKSGVIITSTVTPTNTPITPTNTPVTPTNTPVTPSATPTANKIVELENRIKGVEDRELILKQLMEEYIQSFE